MATFTGTSGADVANADTGVLTGFTGGTVTDLQDLIGDVFIGLGNADTIVAGDAGDNIRGGGGADSIDGGGGNDELRYDSDQGGGGANGVIVNLSETSYSGGAVVVAAHRARDGFLAIDTVLDVEVVRGTAFVDHLIGGDTLNGSSANDGFEAFRGLAGNDIIKGGAGYDEVRYDLDASFQNATLTAFGTAGVTVNLSTGTAIDGFGNTDSLEDIEGARGTNVADAFIGNDEDNKFFGLDGNDVITMGRGFDYAEPGAGNDTVDGTAGVGFEGSYEDRDQVSYDDFGTNGIGVFIDLNLNTLVDPTGGVDTIYDIERLSGTSSGDTLIGADFANQREEMYRGLAGNDVIDGRNGYDIVDYSRDALQATPGTSAVAVNLSSAAVNVSGFGVVAAGTARDGFGNTDTLYYIEGVRGTSFNDVFIGSDGNNQLRTMGGSDTVDGGLGLDTVEMYYTDVFSGLGAIVNLHTLSFTYSAITVAANTARGVDGNTSTLISIENVLGSASDDAIRGSDDRNFLNGWLGDDWLEGMGGNDVINGLDGANSMFGGDGNDTVSFMYDATVNSYHVLNYPEEGFTTWGGVNVNLGTLSAIGIDGQTNVVDGFENVTGTFFNDTITGDGAANSFRGLSGNDTIDGGGGSDTINYSPTNQDGRILVPIVGVNYSEPNVVRVNLFSSSLSLGAIAVAAGTALDGEGGTDTLTSIENVIGSIGDDFIAASLGANVIDGWTGNDTVVLQGVASDYSISQPAGTGQYQVIRLADTNDTDFLRNIETIVFTGGGSIALAAVGANNAGSGSNDEIVGFSGDDTLSGGSGSDLIEGGTGGDSLAGGTGSDELTGGDGDDTVDGGDDNDTLVGGSGAGNDTYMGGSGIDTAIYTSASLSLTIDLDVGGGTGTATGSEIGTDQLSGIENVVGGQGGDSITGDGLANMLSGVAGADLLIGEGGNDTLEGGSGNDTLQGGADDDRLLGDSDDDVLKASAGNDYLDGGANGLTVGDTADFSDATSGLNMVLGANGDAVVTGVGLGTDTLIRIENITGSAHGDVIWGNLGTNVFHGGDGVDWLYGSATGLDVFYGEGGTDYMYGSDDANTFYGGIGDDLMVGFGGVDVMNGEAGDDWLYVDAVDQINGGADFDRVFVYSNGAAFSLDVTAAQVEVVFGGDEADTLNATGYNSTVYLIGAGGNDEVRGGNAVDVLWGYGDQDNLYGNGSTDWLYAGTGSDVLNGGTGDDYLIGGAGLGAGDGAIDYYVFDDGWGVDRVYEFDDGTDIIDMRTVTGLTDMSQLTIGDVAGGAGISFGGNTVYVIGIAAAQLTNADIWVN